MIPSLTPGGVLRAWRERVAHVSLADMGSWFGRSKTAAHSWEKDELVDWGEDLLRELDRRFRAGSAFRDMMRAVKTPEALDPASRWDFNGRPKEGPFWVWIRPAGGRRRVTVNFEWGPVAAEITESCDENGFFVTSPVSTPNPPVIARLGEPGYVDFGHGRIPEALGVKVVNGRKYAHLDVRSITVAVWKRYLFRLRMLWRYSPLARGAGDDGSTDIRQAFDLEDWSPEELRSPFEPEYLPDTQPLDSAGLKRLRKARLLSGEDARRRLNEILKQAEPDGANEPLSRHQFDWVEEGHGSRIEHIRGLLDIAYQADGRACCERVNVVGPLPVRFGAKDGDVVEHRVTFPAFWTGPVWLKLSTGGITTALRWGPYVQKLFVSEPPDVLTFRCAKPDNVALQVFTAQGVVVEAGIGRWPGALDVNRDWQPLGREDAIAVLGEIAPMYVTAAGGTKRALIRFVGQLLRGTNLEAAGDQQSED